MEYIPPRSRAEAGERYVEAVSVIKQEESRQSRARTAIAVLVAEQTSMFAMEAVGMALYRKPLDEPSSPLDSLPVFRNHQQGVELAEKTVAESQQEIDRMLRDIGLMGLMIPGDHLLERVGLVSPQNPEIWFLGVGIAVNGYTRRVVHTGGTAPEVLVRTTISEASRVWVPRTEGQSPVMVVNRHSLAAVEAYLPSGPAFLNPGKIDHVSERLGVEHFQPRI